VVSADRDVRSARDYLATIRSHSVSELPPSVLAREDAELRRLLRIALDVIDDYEATALDDEVTQMTLHGALLVGLSDVATVTDALSDAAWHQAQHGTPAESDRFRELIARIGDQP
jgi:hypothetical protein